MNCPYCNEELIYHDYYGIGWTRDFSKKGDIYKCPNTESEVICDSETFNGFFYTDSNDNLHEGYPC